MSSPNAAPLTPQQDVRSPALSSQFSDADTLLTRDSAYTANTGGRARQSWRDGRIFDLPGGITVNSIDCRSSGNAEDGETPLPTGSDRMLRVRESPEVTPPQAQPDPLRSFFDTSSDSESDIAVTEEPVVINRASSVRVQRPRIVHQRSSAVRSADHGQQVSSLSNPGPSLSKISQILGHTVGSSSQHTCTELDVGPLGTSSRTPKLTIRPVGPAADASTTALPPTPRSEIARQASVVDVPDTPTRTEALDTLPSHLGGFGSMRFSPSASRYNASPSRSRIDGLRCNPVEAQQVLLHRAVSAPPLPFHTHTPQRRVTVRPSDLIVDGHSDAHHRRFRENVVSTPYPTRSAGADQEEQLATAMAANKSGHGRIPECVPPATLTEASPETPMTDRFTSPFRGETVFLELTLAGHEAPQCLVEVSIEDKATFDDEALFRVIAKQYRRKLLGLTRTSVFTAKGLYRVTSSTPDHFDQADFIQLLRKPKLGRKRKDWIVWLRQNQQLGHEHPTAAADAGITSLPPSSHAIHPPSPHQNTPVLKFHFRLRASRVIPVAFTVIFLSCLTTVMWTMFGVPGHKAGNTTLPATLSVATGPFLPSEPSTAHMNESWQSDAQQRVLTGSVLGILVFLLGSMGAAVWVGGSILLL